MPHSESSSPVERRRGRRVGVQASLTLRRDAPGSQPAGSHTTKNLSLTGVYFEAADRPALSVNEMVTAGVEVPEAERRRFPFTRLSGKGRVVRIQPLEEHDPVRTRYGIALEFGDDVTALTPLPSR